MARVNPVGCAANTPARFGAVGSFRPLGVGCVCCCMPCTFAPSEDRRGITWELRESDKPRVCGLRSRVSSDEGPEDGDRGGDDGSSRLCRAKDLQIHCRGYFIHAVSYGLILRM